jgi:DNA mismatch repair protein MutL
MMVGRYPIAFLQLDMPPDLVDVNVHPTKLEVRFQDSGRLYSQLLGTIRDKFLTSDLSAKLSPASSKVAIEAATGAPVATQTELLPWERDSAREERRLPVHEDLSIRPVIGTQQELAHDVAGAHDPATAERLRSDLVNWARGELQAQQRLLDQQAVALRPGMQQSPGATESDENVPQYGHAPLPEYTFQRPHPTTPPAPYPGPSRGVAPTVTEATVPERTASNSAIQIHNKYLVAETDDGLVVIDQHALHERIIYEQIREKVLGGAVESQQLLVPEPVDLSANEATALLQHQTILSQIGVSLEPFGGGTVLVTSYPAMLANFRPAEVLREIVAQITIDGKTPERRDLLDELLHMISCKAAIKAGDRLTPAEVEALVAQRDLFQDSHHCPHGRPTALVLTRDDLDKQFKRT